MKNRNPYQIIKRLRVTEKTMMLENLKNSTSNKSVSRFKLPKYVFDIDLKSTKGDVKWAIEEIYKEQGVQVVKVNTINVKPKERRVRGRIGFVSRLKKAIVTLAEGDSLDGVGV